MFNLLDMLKQGIPSMIINEKQNHIQMVATYDSDVKKGNVLKSVKMAHINVCHLSQR